MKRNTFLKILASIPFVGVSILSQKGETELDLPLKDYDWNMNMKLQKSGFKGFEVADIYGPLGTPGPKHYYICPKNGKYIIYDVKPFGEVKLRMQSIILKDGDIVTREHKDGDKITFTYNSLLDG